MGKVLAATQGLEFRSPAPPVGGERERRSRYAQLVAL